MRNHTRRIVMGAYAVACAGALAFGATQATAAPAPSAESKVACTSSTCGTACFAKGYTHWACWNGNCQCSYGPQP